MSTKKEWLLHVKERKAYEKAYAKETIALEKKLAKLPDGEVVVALTTGPGSNPPTPPVPPPPHNP